MPAVGLDAELLKSEIRKTYASVSEEPERDFIFRKALEFGAHGTTVKAYKPPV
jgi:hypothetical protein